MNELTPTEIAFLNECNSLVTQIARASPSGAFNHAEVRFSGRVGGKGGNIFFSINDKMHSGEFEFRAHEECIERLNFLLTAATKGRL